MTDRRTPAALAIALAAALLLAGCTPPSDPAPEPTSSAEPTVPSPSPSATADAEPEESEPVETRTLPLDGGELEVGVHPLVRADGPSGVGELVVLTLDLSVTTAPPSGTIGTGQVFADPDGGDTRRGFAGALRLLDLDADVAHLLATDGAAEGVATSQFGVWDRIAPGDVVRVQSVFAAPPPGVDELAVLIPRTGLVDALPVVDGPVPDPLMEPDGDPVPSLDLDAVAAAAVVPLEVYTEDLAGTLRTESDAEGTEVALAADVLFALDQADLSPEAAAALATAAGDILTREPGPVSVVGHTDDQADEAYNLDLSRRRAQAVADALAPLLGPGYPLTVEGRGESDPAVPGTSADARARNRRVDVSVSTPLLGGPLGERATELPEAPQLTAAGAEGVVVENVSRWPFEVTAAPARRVGGNVVVDVAITALAGPEPGLSVSPLMLGTFRDPRDFAVTDGADSARGTVLLQGTTAVFPLFAAVGDGPSPRLCACALNLAAGLVEGQTLVASIVYPELDVMSLTLQNTAVTSADVPFRLTDIPVG